MSNCTANVPRGHQFAIEEYGSSAGDAFTVRLPVERFGLRGQTNTVIDEGINGSLWEVKDDEIIANELISGTMVLNPRPNTLQKICMCIFGDGAFASNVKLPGNICSYFQVGHSDPTVDKVYRYNNCVTSSAEFSASDTSQLLSLLWNIEGQSRTVTDDVSTNWPTLALSSQQPFVFRQGTLTVGGTATKIKDFRFTVNNNLQLGDFYNSLNREEMPSSLQQFELIHTSPWDSGTEAAKIGTAQTDIAATLNFVSGTKQLQLEFPSLYTNLDEPEIAGRLRIHNQYTWRAKYDSADAIAAPVQLLGSIGASRHEGFGDANTTLTKRFLSYRSKVRQVLKSRCSCFSCIFTISVGSETVSQLRAIIWRQWLQYVDNFQPAEIVWHCRNRHQLNSGLCLSNQDMLMTAFGHRSMKNRIVSLMLLRVPLYPCLIGAAVITDELILTFENVGQWLHDSECGPNSIQGDCPRLKAPGTF